MARLWFTLVLCVPAAADCPAKAAHAASLLQRIATPLPLLREVPEELYEAPKLEDYAKRECQKLQKFRNESWLPVLLNREELLEKAQDQLQVAQELLRNRDDPTNQQFTKLRQLEQQRWSQDPVQLSLFNPNLVSLPDSWRRSPEERWLASFRHMELSAEWWQNCLPKAASSVVLLAVLDAQFRPTRPLKLLNSRDLLVQPCQCTRYGFLYVGPEDPRLLRMPTGDIMMLYTALRPTSEFTECHGPSGRMYIAQVMEDLSVKGQSLIPMASEELGRPADINGRPLGGWEKNWGVFRYMDENKEKLFIEESVHPHVVLSMNSNFVAGEEVYNSTSPVVKHWMRTKHRHHLHGGVAPLLFENEFSLPGLPFLEPPFYLSILHTRLTPPPPEDKKAWYFYENYLCAFEAKPPFSIIRVGHKLLPLKPGLSVFESLVAFPTQMLRDEDDLMIFYGAGDAMSRALRLPIGRLPEFLE